MIKWTSEIHGRRLCILHIHMRYKACNKNDNLCFVDFFFFLMLCFLNVCKCISSGRRRKRRRKNGEGSQRKLAVASSVQNCKCIAQAPLSNYIYLSCMKSCMSFPPEGGWHKGSNPDCSTEHCAAHMKKIRSSVGALEPWARNAAPSAHRPGSRAAFFHSRTIILVLL